MNKDRESKPAFDIDLPAGSDFGSYFEASKKTELPAALWRLPGQSTVHFITDFSGAACTLKPDLDEMKKGFVMAPFEQEEGGICRHIQASLYLNSETPHPGLEPTFPNNRQESDNFEAYKNALTHSGHASSPTSKDSKALEPDILPEGESEHQRFVRLVEEGVEAIKRGEMLKVVPSRIKRTPLPEDFDATETFHWLCEAYPNAFVSYVYLPDEGSFLGATPELLLSTEGNTFRTVALAGTQPYNDDTPLCDVLWSQKEIEEQALVSRYIINCFKKIRLREFQEKGPRTSRAGNLIHLKTEFLVDMNATNFPQLGTVMLELLHPTSAVCGMPKEQAMQFIQSKEQHSRGYFSGYLGPVNMPSGSNLYVNLRCMRLLNGEAILYAGAGVTEDSQPEKEWQETEHKTRTLLDVILKEKGKSE
ncbi:chorismate-binding protein [Roseivirga sp. BDSF3-8]|uniref:chorismate-binding protein n=1 Tax=Roseivirga sp. BDSF3-8 TaxID=3241598 RepID=UPI0035327B37